MAVPSKVFVDTNIVLDLLTEREPFFKDAEKLFTLSDKGFFELFMSADSFTTIAYFLNKIYGKQDTIRHLVHFKNLVHILPVNEKTIELALVSNSPDFEDAVQIAIAETNGMDCIITRDVKGFKNSQLSVFDSKSFIGAFFKG